ncbi:hypothetical protein F5J12DRAFT_885656 [Pisolithus orientalis]|uniref:uncharacterized protein n=1 Tax=Pisolithus orientalis TaxID=936130 RepID=UPI0022246AF4|nr:uncharacterized protein F5J12DRAFT_885656 [Pisolithus orientalis]KAI5980431.1 hypothetical protein F5J12DRAFT_885656 [Pisolithus orientalis]
MALVTERAEVGNPVIPNAGPKNKPRFDEHPNCPRTLCLYPGPSGTQCLQPISCSTVPEHFESHGIKAIYRAGGGYLVARHNFVRHVREKHLGHTRGGLAALSSGKSRRQHTSFHAAADDAEPSNESHINERANRAKQLCQYQDPDKGLCMLEITCATVSEHFATYHGVRAMSRSQWVDCRWVGCVDKRLRRHSFVRHIREKHLGHTRGSVLKSERAPGQHSLGAALHGEADKLVETQDAAAV